MTHVDPIASRASGPTTRPAPVRVLIEYLVPGERRAVQSALEAAGYEVSACGGPHDAWGAACPVLHGARCDLADAADVVLCGLWVENPENRAVIRGLKSCDPELPMVVDAPSRAAEIFPETIAGTTAVFLQTAEDAVVAVEAALARSGD